MRITGTPTFDCDEIQKQFGFDWNHLIDAAYAENDSFLPIECDDGSLETLYEDKAYFFERNEVAYQRTINQIGVVEYLREFGYRGPVLMYIHY